MAALVTTLSVQGASTAVTAIAQTQRISITGRKNNTPVSVQVSDDGANWSNVALAMGQMSGFQIPDVGSWPLVLQTGWQARLFAGVVDNAGPGGAAFALRMAVE